MSTQTELTYTYYPYGGYWAWGYPYQLNFEQDMRDKVYGALGVIACYASAAEYNFDVCRCDVPDWKLNITVKQTDDVDLPPLHIVADPTFSGGKRVPAVIAPIYADPEERWCQAWEFGIELLSGYAVELPNFNDAFSGDFGPPPDPPPDANAVTIVQLTLDPTLVATLPQGPYRYVLRAKVTDTDIDPDTQEETLDIPPTIKPLLYGSFTLKDC